MTPKILQFSGSAVDKPPPASVSPLSLYMKFFSFFDAGQQPPLLVFNNLFDFRHCPIATKTKLTFRHNAEIYIISRKNVTHSCLKLFYITEQYIHSKIAPLFHRNNIRSYPERGHNEQEIFYNQNYFLNTNGFAVFFLCRLPCICRFCK